MRVLLTGSNGMLGGNLATAWRDLGMEGELVAVTHWDIDLRDARATRALVEDVHPDVVLHAAARVGGIAANSADLAGFLMDNLRIDSSVLSASAELGVSRLVYFGSSCMYPRDYRQPLVESDILAAPLEPTNEGYAIAKIAGARFCEYQSRQRGLTYRVLIPSNMYGVGDNYSMPGGHLIAATIAKAHAAKVAGARSIDVWGDGTPLREFTFAGDLTRWVVSHLDEMTRWPAVMNVGGGQERSVLDYYRAALAAVGYDAELVTDPSKPGGMMHKLMDSSLARSFGWEPRTSLEEGMAAAYADYLERAA